MEDCDENTPRVPVLHDKQKSNESSSNIEVDISSVVTQVTTRDAPDPRSKHSFQLTGRTSQNQSWKTKVVVFTASLGKYADPLLDWLDRDNVVRWRLFREACLPWEGNYVKDLSFLGRDLCDTIIVDNSPHSYVFQPENALPISTFIDDMHDQDLLKLIPILDKLETVADVRSILAPASNTKGGFA
ncbi:NLI interacting factor-like phosphatase-domain-containing protein [Dunaliella salina]|uniref:Mitochondrial import inner membrane translocase subunit TIM50 n=1 Tax=Dunaliella salina TaxID=3046 RepID=A0ABQ7GJS6_DUNSA|nr:NLI interacting factor-like phosphatase-domain-containing protein [Dunaliella salina]|eukprot:KAF5834849.1 NLI interacting factor-like phosphatase-domain-containing protein [Dunaliella salina]